MSRSAAGILIFFIVVTSAGTYWTVLRKPNTVQIKQKGSDTLLILAQSWAEAYMIGHEDVEVVVSGGGSGAGISALINRQVDMASTSREIKQAEMEVAREHGVRPVEWKVAIDGISVIINWANKVSELSYGQLKGLHQ